MTNRSKTLTLAMATAALMGGSFNSPALGARRKARGRNRAASATPTGRRATPWHMRAVGGTADRISFST